MSTNEDVRKWYNSFSAKQKITGINLRHYSILNQLVAAGLKKNHQVLEIGCGIGTLTELLHRFIQRGELVATDISDESIETARKRIGESPRIRLVVSDMTDFQINKKFDFIVLPDVLEHIPVEQHNNLFRVIAMHMHENSRVFIHIPHPKALTFIRENYPERLQIIDQSIEADELMRNTYENGLELIYYKSYGLFHHEKDYVSALFKLQQVEKLNPLSKTQIIRKKMCERLRYYKHKLF